MEDLPTKNSDFCCINLNILFANATTEPYAQLRCSLLLCNTATLKH